MIVLSMSLCPPSLHGDITKWLMEIDTGVFVGKLSARVRDELWERICKYIGSGRAIMIYSAQNPQGFSVRTHNTIWQTRNYDGLTFMLHPLNAQKKSEAKAVRKPKSSEKKVSEKSRSTSKAATQVNQKTKKQSRAKTDCSEISAYTVIDIETTGLDTEHDDIIEIAALKVENNEIIDRYSSLICINRMLPVEIIRLTGITDEMLKEGNDAHEAIQRFVEFIGESILVSHNSKFDLSFINRLCENEGYGKVSNTVYDSLTLSRRYVREVENYRLATLAEYFSIDISGAHRALQDSIITYQLFEKIKEELKKM